MKYMLKWTERPQGSPSEHDGKGETPDIYQPRAKP